MTDQIISESQIFIENIFNKCCNNSFVFHNLEHTHNVVNRSREIATHYNLQHEDLIALNIAAFFHDTGYLFVPPKEHERKSVEIFLEFSKIHSLSPAIVEKIVGCILATKFPTNPQNFLHEIICDADTYHLGTDAFKDFNSKMCEETHLCQTVENENEFYLKTIALLEKHQFYTFYCQELLEPVKKFNLTGLINRHLSKS